MTLLRTYLVMAVLRGVAIVMAVLVAVRCGIEFVGQLNDVGTGEYGLQTALIYIALRVPRTIFTTLPIGALIGSLLSLGNLAVHRELIVMRASGVSSLQLLSAVGLAGLMLAVLMVLLGESVAPSLGAYASELRTRAMHAESAVADGQATWLREGDRIVSLRRQAGDLGYGGGVLLFELGPGQTLREVARADSANLEGNRWVLSNYAETSFEEGVAAVRTGRESSEAHGLNPDLLELSIVRADLLDTPSLIRYISYLRANDLDAHRYLVAYWSRLANVVSVVIMTVLALPFVFGGLRSAGAGARLLVGLIIGLTYYVAGQVLTSGGEVYGVDPLVIAWAPTALLVLVTAFAFARIR
ncbi:MAG TPA: LPS export ABC transporter permease LptG [Rhodanobacteraceae bacterium]|nr:LPS export ABC transporter permease LptG [Rhodanobacteraceae bacterium]